LFSLAIQGTMLKR